MVPPTLSYHLDTTVGQVARAADQPKFQRPAARPPAETDALDLPVHPRGEAHGLLFLAHEPIVPYVGKYQTATLRQHLGTVRSHRVIRR